VRFVAFATDYDETLAGKGVVEPRTLAALEHVKSSGRKLLLVTGRDLDDLVQVFPEHAVFDAIVAENGALLYLPSTKKEKKLAETPPPEFAEGLRRQGATPLSVGRVIVATRVPYQTLVIEEIRRLGLELQVIFNKGAVMVLPAGVHKGTGLKAALAEMKLSPHNVVGAGDAENDHAFLAECECGVAVGNALPALKDRADLVMKGNAEDGVLELLEQLVKDDLRSALSGRPALLWRRGNAEEVPIRLARTNARHHLHARKYAEGDLVPDRSFYFRGAEKKLNLRAPDLVQFGELAAGVDDDTWLHHLRQGDYSKWFRTEVKDEELARDAEVVERDRALDARQSREKIRAAIAQRYTLPAQP
jgi:HAD superfamily hydrolase (TIGR01484 family)